MATPLQACTTFPCEGICLCCRVSRSAACQEDAAQQRSSVTRLMQSCIQVLEQHTRQELHSRPARLLWSGSISCSYQQVHNLTSTQPPLLSGVFPSRKP